MNDNLKVGPLTRVSLKFSAAGKGSAKTGQQEFTFEFVHGIATEGLTAFEMALYDKRPGDIVHIDIESYRVAQYYEHLLAPLTQASGNPLPGQLQAEVTGVCLLTDRELVRALAEKNEGNGCGGDGGCGGGCG